MPIQLTKIFMCCSCCCKSENNVLKRLRLRKKRLKEHKYCGCKERESSRRRAKMIMISGDRRTLVEDEVCEALEYNYDDNSEVNEDFCVTEPTVPFTHEFASPLCPQSVLVVEGVVKEKSFRFAINLVIGNDEWPNIAFHFNPRLDQRYVARNTLLGGHWGVEEGNGLYKFPFVRGKPFMIEIYLTHSEFLVAVNGVHYCSYAYRISLLKITGIDVTGAVDLSRVQRRTSLIYPSPLPPDYPSSPFFVPLKSDGITEHEIQITPMYGILQNKLTPNSEIEITGRVKLLPVSFFVNFQKGTNICPHPEIPLHISSRFTMEKTEFVVLANSWVGKGWGREEFTTIQPFIPGSEFTLRIMCLDDLFVAHVNNQPLLAFKHRVPYTNIDTILIHGDIYVYNIRVNL